MPITVFSLAVVGAAYPNRRGPTRRFAIAVCAPGDPVDLEFEPSNPADPRAIKVVDRAGVQLGYITAERASWVGSMIRNGRNLTAIFQAVTKYGAVIRVGLDGIVPTIPEFGSDGVDDDPDFWPDIQYDND